MMAASFHSAVLVAALLAFSQEQCSADVNAPVAWVSRTRNNSAFVSRNHHLFTDLMLVRGGAESGDANKESDEMEESDVEEMSSEDEEKNWEEEDWEEVVPVIVETSEMNMEDFVEQEETEGEITMLEEQVEVTVEEVEVRKESPLAEPQEPDLDEQVFHEEILVQSDSPVVDEDDVRYNAGTTDGEMADDEGMDSISPVEEAAELAVVTAGGTVMAEEEEQGDAIEDTVTESTSGLEVGTTITDEMKQVLRQDLKYTRRDIKLMRPEIASMVVYNKLLRPIEGMPRNWYIEGAGPAGPLREHAVKIAIAVAAVSGVTAVGILGDGLDMSELTRNLKQIPAALAKLGKKTKKDATAQLSEVKEALDEVTAQKTFSEQEMNEMENEVPHSIKPGEKPAGLMGKEDESALDKFLTKIETMIKAFFNIKI
jgi:hypothetical protein